MKTDEIKAYQEREQELYRVWVVVGILHKQVVCGFLVFAKDAEDAYQKTFNVFGRIRQHRVRNSEMKLVVEEVTDFDQVFSLETFRGKAAWEMGR